MTGKIKKIADPFFSVLGFIVMGGGILFLVFIENPVRYFFSCFIPGGCYQVEELSKP
ncbi:hypothetical protein [Chryseobacterium elymi]|uniref:hypothetical protein n=1 Tax=Chryseobacterium elymi TaxID=395936 RepID=UPI0013009F28|nr:hypothetical protein [Chryseobacterium elymi]